MPDIGKAVLRALVHVAWSSNEGGRQDNPLSTVYWIFISIAIILQKFVFFSTQFALVHLKEQQPLSYNIGIHIC